MAKLNASVLQQHFAAVQTTTISPNSVGTCCNQRSSGYGAPRQLATHAATKTASTKTRKRARNTCRYREEENALTSDLRDAPTRAQIPGGKRKTVVKRRRHPIRFSRRLRIPRADLPNRLATWRLFQVDLRAECARDSLLTGMAPRSCRATCSLATSQPSSYPTMYSSFRVISPTSRVGPDSTVARQCDRKTQRMDDPHALARREPP